MTREEWEAEGKRRFGDDIMQWKFVCPVCGHVASTQDYKDVGASSAEVGFNCVGRHIEGSAAAFMETKQGPCDYSGGGLFKLNPLEVDGGKFFNFAEATP